jgi:hypothetical protein
MPIIADLVQELVGVLSQMNIYASCVRVPRNIVERLLT